MPESFTHVDIRVLGSLIEKERTTPEYYPLSLNSLVNACNQLSNRDPVVQFDEGTVTRSIDALRQRGLIRATRGIDARVTKYAHRVDDVFGLNSREVAVLCVLMLRGPQTSGEIRTRTSRLETLEDMGEVEATLEALAVKNMATRLPRQPGQKEVRYTQILTGEASGDVPDQTSPAQQAKGDGGVDRLLLLEEAVEEMRKEIADLRAQLETFRAQFE